MPSIIPKPRARKKQIKGLPSGVNVVPLSVDYFHPGMYIDSDIYIKVNDVYVLFCKNVLLDDALVDKMKNRISNADYSVYIAEEYVEEVKRQNHDFRAIAENEGYLAEDGDTPEERLRKKTEELKSFIKIEEDTRTLLRAMESTHVEFHQRFDQIVGNISWKVNHSDISIILQCINNIRKTDDYLYSHSRNVATLNGLIGKWMDFDAVDINKLIRIGLLHDMGKLRIPAEILDKPARLSEAEFEVMKQHPVHSYDILRETGITDSDILSGVRSHHERNNGMGYPDHLEGKNIPLFAKITAVSDVYDAMVAKRPYKRSHSPFEILSEFSQSRFSDLDLHVITAFLENIPKQFVGKRCLLSDGRFGMITYLNPSDFEYPIVSVDNRLVKTNKFLRCISVDSFTVDDI